MTGIPYSDTNEYLIEHGKCCACGAPLKDSDNVNMVMLSKKAKWKNPVWGNLLAYREDAGYALGVVCDNCVNEETGQILHPVKHAVEVQGGPGIKTPRNIFYHKVEDLEDGEPSDLEGNAGRLAGQIKQDLEKDNEDIIMLTRRDAEEINERLLRQSECYLMLINQSFVDGLKNPMDEQHHDIMRQIEVAVDTKKITVIIYDKEVTPEDIKYVEQITANLDVKATMTHDFNLSSEELSKTVGEIILKNFGEQN